MEPTSLHPYEHGPSSRPRAPVSPDRPLVEMTIKVFGWERGEAEIDARFAGAGDPFEAASADDAAMILDLVQARVAEEIAEAFKIFRTC